jgi:hypothetical protein
MAGLTTNTPAARELTALLREPSELLGGKSLRDLAVANLETALKERTSTGLMTDTARWATQRILDYTDGSPEIVSKINLTNVSYSVNLQYDGAQCTAPPASTYLSDAPIPTMGRAKSSSMDRDTKQSDAVEGGAKRSSAKSARSRSRAESGKTSDGSRPRTSTSMKRGATSVSGVRMRRSRRTKPTGD